MSQTAWILLAAAWLWLSFQARAQELSAERQFAKLCAVCHGADASGADRGPALVNNRGLRGRSESDIQKLIRDGSGSMPAFPLPETEVRALARFVRSLNASAYEASPA